MNRVALILALACLALSCPAADATTNVVRQVASPAARAQCEARTKSGTRCKRNALPNGKLCRQHKKIEECRKSTERPSCQEKRTPNT